MSEYLDTSCIVKWFKKDEEYHEQSLKLRERILNFETEFVMSYYGLLELIRALVKSKYPKEKIEESFQNMYDLYGIGALKNVRIEEVLYLAKNIEIELNLYASDALHVACAVHRGCRIFWSEDSHHLKEKTKEYMRTHNITVRTLKQIEL